MAEMFYTSVSLIAIPISSKVIPSVLSGSSAYDPDVLVVGLSANFPTKLAIGRVPSWSWAQKDSILIGGCSFLFLDVVPVFVWEVFSGGRCG